MSSQIKHRVLGEAVTFLVGVAAALIVYSGMAIVEVMVR
jgi:hypothetical protein